MAQPDFSKMSDQQIANYLYGELTKGGGITEGLTVAEAPIKALSEGVGADLGIAGRVLSHEETGADLKKQLKEKAAEKIPTPDPSGKLTKAQEKYLKPGDIKPPAPPTTEQLLNQYMGQYINEISQLGPEYNDEMAFLKPYLAPTNETMSSLVAQSKANESPTGDTGVMAADVQAGQAAAAHYNQPIPGSSFTTDTQPGFNAQAGAAKEYTKDLPYSQLLTTLLAAGKNQILGYSTIPNLSSINTANMPPDVKGAYSAAVEGLGYNPATNLPNTQTAATQAAQAAQLQAAQSQPALQGGGSTG